MTIIEAQMSSVSNRYPKKFRVGVSQCLLGEPVRYDGGHKRHSAIMEMMGPRVEWVPVCPEVEVGLPVPREPMILVNNSGIRGLIGKDSGKDYMEEMKGFCRKKVQELEAMNLDGFIFKKSSPSCGLQEVEIYADPDTGKPVSGGRGVFAEEFRKKLISIPAAEEDELNSHEGIEKFFQNMTEYKKQRTGK